MTPFPPGGARLRIVGIDPGTRHLGYGVVDAEGGRLTRVAGGALRATAGDLPARLLKLYAGLVAALREHAPAVAAVETVFIGDNARSALAIGEARGMALVAAAGAGLAVVGYPPATVKRAVAGSGRAGKEQIRAMVRIVLALPEPPETDHEADALALAATHALRAREEAYRRALPPAVAAQLAVAGARTLPEAVRRQLAASGAAPTPARGRAPRRR